MFKTQNTKFYRYHGIFSEINKLRASICLQRAWRTCRYNPQYEMCERVLTRTLNELNSIYNFNIILDDTNDEYKKYKLKKKQERFKIELEKTREFLKYKKKYN